MHHLYKIEYINNSQYGFTPQKSTIDAAMAVKQFIEPELEKGKLVIAASLDVKCVFDAAWWPAILKELRDAQCPQNLYQLTQDYFRERRQYYHSTVVPLRRISPKVVPKVHAADPAYGTYNITPFSH
jgi:hypothetical protein